ncbi:hypothetical protein CIL05_08320 [Virgibacillus profundi]|uniref:YtxH domain-containing protein n=1 Tax=Virgibacillus profundi TaxID=2024555 RepID=A0A2A2IF52_9BACI|nr:hypothetical protein [Virgibacillus profundi]PAV29874.1 hypothetical protein CIL05_08320 [Virgibacillus profundi]PXY54046.1 hypothetical protein CIT14_08405 [Virgibacillus profundi]
MKKRYIISAVGAAGATAAGIFLNNKDNRNKIKETAKNVSNKVKDYRNGTNTAFEDAGVPDQSADNDLAQLENAKMVSEGSQFGVQYYNENKEENTSENQQNS